MTLENRTLAERRRLTRMSPVLVSAFPNMGKSFCVEGLDDEDRLRTFERKERERVFIFS